MWNNREMSVLLDPRAPPFAAGEVPAATNAATLVPAPDTSTWYKTQYGCLITDPTLISRHHSFPDAPIPRGLPTDPAAYSKICLSYRTAWPRNGVDPTSMVVTERNHPQFAFNGGAPNTPSQIDVESMLRCLDAPLSRCQRVVVGVNAPVFSSAVYPPEPTGVAPGPQNAANPVAAIVRPGDGGCRAAADQVATAMSGRFVHNPTRQDTKRFVVPFSPPGIGTQG
jgi:hypothetical protein